MYKSVTFTEKRPFRPGTGIKYGFEETEPRISVWNIPSGKTGLPFHSTSVFSDVPLLPEIFRWTTQKGVSHLVSNRISGNFL